DLSVAPGERLALVGRNGSGKSTLLLAIAGLLPHRGRIEVSGEALSPPRAAALRRKMGFLFSSPDDQLLFPTVFEDVVFGGLAKGMSRPAAETSASSLLAKLGVESLAKSPVHELSHGQKQRVALAGALIGPPDLLLLDEPSAALDPVGQRDLVNLLSDLPIAMLIATHDMAFAERLCSRFLVLEDKRITSNSRHCPSDRWGSRS
ncbi:MAG: ABC transporter ATP-binding protein, partial [Myxococcales bacterium]|nr:ABC transporter ATP-binding protein [Myxococcales bacterium]